MVQGLAFLSKKGFNPHNQVNRKQVFEAQQHNKLEQERIRKREEQLRREREDEELCAARHGDGSQAQLRFMYDAPPGLKKDDQQQQQAAANAARKPTSEAVKDVTQIQPSDDAAAAAFRRMLAATTQPPPDNGSGDLATSDTYEGAAGADGESKLGFAPVLQGTTLERELEKSNDTRSALEKAVGRRDRGGALTLEEQLSRFPQLKNAPMAKGMSATDVNVSFKPLGAQMRNVKCLACGVWGHSRGDRECQTTGWDPFSSGTARAAAPAASSSIRPSKIEDTTRRDDTRSGDNGDSRRLAQSDDDFSSSSSSSSSSDDSRRKRKRKHRSSSKHKKKEKESSRKRSRKHRSRSPSRRSKKSHHRSRKKRERSNQS